MSLTAWHRWSKENRDYATPHLRLRIVAALVNALRPKAYADLGCAQGTLGSLTPGPRYVGVDFVTPAPGAQFEFHRCDFNSEPLPSVLADVDVVTCSGLLEYIEDLPRFFQSVRDSTRPGTNFVLSYFNMNHWSRVIRLAAGRTCYFHPDWRNFLSPADMTATLQRTGFSIRRKVPVGLSLSTPASLQDSSSQDPRLRNDFAGSHLLAHQFVWVASRE
jgi:SAM-dependent methyltransferase